MPRTARRRTALADHRASRVALNLTPTHPHAPARDPDAAHHPCAGRVDAAPCADLLGLYCPVPALMLVTDANGAVESLSDLLVERLGVPRAQWLHRPAGALFDAPGRARFEQELWPVLRAGGRLPGTELRLPNGPDGAPMHVVLSGYAVPGPRGELRGAVLFAQDITAHRRHAAELDAERQRLDDILAATDAGTWEWNVATDEVKFNERWASMLGHTLASLGAPTVDHTWKRLTHPADLARCERALRRHFDGASPRYECSFRMRHRLGGWVWILARGKVRTRTADGRAEWMLGTHLDITRLKTQQARLRDTERMLDRVCETAAIGGFEADLDHGLLTPTLQASGLLALSPGVPAPLPALLRRLDPRDRLCLLRAALRARRSGVPWQLDLKAPSASGVPRMLHVTGRDEPGPEGEARMLGSVQDVSARYADRARLDAALKRLRVASMASGMGVWSIDDVTLTLQGDAQFREMLALDGAADRLSPRSVLRRLLRDDRARFVQGMRQAMQRRTAHQDEVRVAATGGASRSVKVAAIIERDCDGRALAITGAAWDVTESRDLERRLGYQRRLLQVTLNSIADAVVTTDSAGQPDWLNSAAVQLLSATFERPDALPAEVARAALDCMRHGDARWSEQPIRVRTRTGEDLALDFSASPIHLASEAPHGAVIVMRNVTQQQRNAEAMAWRASHDPLTNLLNRAGFEQRLNAALAAVAGSRVPHALLYVDLDQFKLVNDACGHVAGDVLLQQVATLITECVRAGDTVARVGGDEFAIVLGGCDAEQARRAAQGICSRLDSYRFHHEGRRFRVGASIGLAAIDHTVFGDAGAVLKAADAACFAAKDSGRNRVHTWLADDATIAERRGDMQWVARIEQALDDGRFELHGQRIVPLAAAEAGLHVELLLRLRETDGQLVSPGAFIPAAERFNLSPRLDAWVVRAALDWLAAADALERFSMVSVNLSGSSVGDPLFRETVVDLLQRQRAEVRRRICLEITETSAVTHMDNARALVDQVRGLGVSVALDDFGAGASSFGYLRQLKVDFLKIDGQYVRDLLDDPLHSAAIKCFVEVARVTGVRTVAEFVEREDVLQELRRIGVDFGQGYLLHRPQPLDRLGGPWDRRPPAPRL